jgi:HlyD family secretion protein
MQALGIKPWYNYINIMKKRTIAIIAATVVILILIVYGISKNSGSKYQFVTVARGTITEEVDVTGNTTPVQSLDLAFQSGGTIAAVYKYAGDTVGAGQPVARLDTSNLQAQLAQAQASVDAAQATLEKLQAGATPQDVQVSQSALAATQQTLANTYTGIPDALTTAFAKANDAIRNQI